MKLSLPKKLGVSVKPVNQWGAKEAGTVLGGGIVGSIVGNQIGGAVDKMRGDSAAKRAQGQAAREAEAAQVAQQYNDERNAGRGILERISNTTVPGVTAAALDPRFRDSQLKLMDQLTAQAEGRGPSLAQMQFQQAGNTALQKAMGAIRAATGTNAALGGRTAALASTNLLGNIAAESGMARLKEQQDAQNALAGLTVAGRTGDLQTRQQDINLGTANADSAIKQLGVQTQAGSELLGDTRTRYENHYNRGAQGDAAKAKAGGGGGFLPAILGAAGALGASYFGSPAMAPAGAAAGKAAGESLSLTGGTPEQQQPKMATKGRPFGRMSRKG